MDGVVNRSNGVSAGDFSGTGSVRRLGSLFADMGGNSGMDVNAMMIVIPRISSPALTAQEIAEMDPADLTAMSVEVVTFLLKKSVLAGLPTA